MPTFSPDDVVDFCVAEAVVRAGQEAEREANETAREEQAEADRHSPDAHRAWAEQHELM